MKSKLFISLLLLFALLLSCENGPEPHSGVLIKGNIPKKGNIVNGVDSFSIDDISKVLLFSPPSYGHGLVFRVVNVQDGGFQIDANLGTAVALIFLTSNYEYVGNLNVNDFNLLPLGNLSAGENTIIDLASLTMVGNHIIPSHDPFGNEIIISQAALQSFQEVDAYFESLSKNMDTDNDGFMDFLNHEEIILTSKFGLYVGHWGVNATPPDDFDSSSFDIKSQLTVIGGSNINPVGSALILSGPAGNPYPNIELSWMANVPSGADFGFNALFSNLNGTDLMPFEDGIYTLNVNGTTNYTFQFSNFDASTNLVIISPTLAVNGSNQITSVLLDYKLPNGASIDPSMLMSCVMIQMNDSNFYQFHDSPWLTTETGFYQYTFPDPVNLSQLHHITIAYKDLLGNDYLILWD